MTQPFVSCRFQTQKSAPMPTNRRGHGTRKDKSESIQTAKKKKQEQVILETTNMLLEAVQKDPTIWSHPDLAPLCSFTALAVSNQELYPLPSADEMASSTPQDTSFELTPGSLLSCSTVLTLRKPIRLHPTRPSQSSLSQPSRRS